MQGDYQTEFYIMMYVFLFLLFPVVISLKQIIRRMRLFFDSSLVIVENISSTGYITEDVVKLKKPDTLEYKGDSHVITPELFRSVGKHKKITLINGKVVPSLYFYNYLWENIEETGLNKNQIEALKERYRNILNLTTDSMDKLIKNAKLGSNITSFDKRYKQILIALAVVGGICLIVLFMMLIFYNDMSPFIRSNFSPTSASNKLFAL